MFSAVWREFPRVPTMFSDALWGNSPMFSPIFLVVRRRSPSILTNFLCHLRMNFPASLIMFSVACGVNSQCPRQCPWFLRRNSPVSSNPHFCDTRLICSFWIVFMMQNDHQLSWKIKPSVFKRFTWNRASPLTISFKQLCLLKHGAKAISSKICHPKSLIYH